MDHPVVRLAYCSDNVEINRSRQHLAVIMVGVIAADLCSAGCAKKLKRIATGKLVGKISRKLLITGFLFSRIRTVKGFDISDHKTSLLFID